MPRRPLLHVSLLAVFFAPAPAFAAAMPPEPAPAPAPGVYVSGPATVDSISVVVRCSSETLVDTNAQCHIEGTFRLTAGLEPVHVASTAPHTEYVRLDGEVVDDAQTLEPGSVTRVAISYDLVLSTSSSTPDEPWLVVPIRARHFILGESSSVRRSGDGAFGTLVEGPALSFVGEAHVEAETDDVTVHFAGRPIEGSASYAVEHTGITLGLEAPTGDASVVQHGGPVLSLGSRFDLFREDDGRFLLRVAYEMGIVDYLVASLSFETNFDSIMESAVIEIASPEAMILLPSAAVGIGVVARQLGQRDADAGLRLRAAFNMLPGGLTADFDYWPDLGDWTAIMAARISI